LEGDVIMTMACVGSATGIKLQVRLLNYCITLLIT